MEDEQDPSANPLSGLLGPSTPPEAAPFAVEPLRDYVRRAVVGDSAFQSWASQARGLGVGITLGRLIRPAFFSLAVVERHYCALSLLRTDPAQQGFGRVLDYLWIGRDPDHPPLDLRMAEVPKFDLGLAPEPQLEWKVQERLRVVREAASRRDFLVARICGALRTGVWQASGYVPGDVSRTMMPIASAWWGDHHMECAWRDGELRPNEGATPGRPTFLGVALSLADPCRQEASWSTARTDNQSSAPDLDHVNIQAAVDRSRRKSGYWESDAPLIAKMHQRVGKVEKGRTISVSAAAWDIVHEAEGSSEPESKQSRLIRHYYDTYPEAERPRSKGKKPRRTTEN